MVLVLLKIAPENPLHEVIGLFCFLVYVCLPVYYFIPKVVQKFATKPEIINSSAPIQTPKMVLHLLLCCFVSITIIFRIEQIKSIQNTLTTTDLGKFKVMQTRTKEALIYTKTIPAFYSIEHSPLFCWTGSGYELSNIDEKVVDSHKIYTGILIKGKDRLKTAWWFSNGKVQTTSQLEWRWASFLGNSSCKLINVTAENERDLLVEVRRQIRR